MMILVQLAFETLIDMVDVGDAGLDKQVARLFRTLAAAADKNDRRTAFITIDHAAEHQLAHIGDEFGIDDPVRFVDPGDMYGTFGVTDEQVLHAGADIDEQGTGVVLAELPGCLWGDASELIAHTII